MADFVRVAKLSDEQTKQNNTCLHGPTYNFIQESAMRDQNIDMSDQDEDNKPMPRFSLSFLSWKLIQQFRVWRIDSSFSFMVICDDLVDSEIF